MKTVVSKRNLLRKLAQAVLTMEDLDKLFPALAEMVRQACKVRWVSLAICDESFGQCIIQATSGAQDDLSKDEPDAWLKQRQGIVKERLFEEFAEQLSVPLKEELKRNDTWVSLPLLDDVHLKLMGVLNLGPTCDDEHLTSADLELLSEFAQLCVVMITQARKYHRIKEEMRHHQNILDNLISGIIAIDAEEKITVFNRTAARILNSRSEDWLGKSVRQLPRNLASLLLDTLHQGKSYSRQELSLVPENTLIGASTAQSYDDQGKFLGACMVFSNLSEVKRKEKQLRRQNMEAYWSNLADSLGQEVKESIVATKIFTELFPKKYEDAEFRWTLYSTLKRDMEKLDSFSNKMLNFARTAQTVNQPCQIEQVLEAAIKLAWEDKQDARGIVWERKYSRNLAPILGDERQLKEAFSNIISNALEAMGQEGTIRISIDEEEGPEMLIYNFPEAMQELPPGKLIVVKISDTGCGITPETLPYLFDPFFTTKKARTGLGLAFSKKIVQRHQGMIGVQSKPGEGATFWVLLPVLPRFSVANIK